MMLFKTLRERIRVGLVSLLLLTSSLPLWAEEGIFVIVNQEAGLKELDQKQVMSLFLGRARSFPNGLAAKPFDHKVDSSIRERFFEQLTGKQVSDIDAYWARLSYSGRAFPPKNLNTASDVLEEVARNKQAISYVNGITQDELATQGIVVVFSLKGR